MRSCTILIPNSQCHYYSINLNEHILQCCTWQLVQVSEQKWRLTVVNGPQYELCPTYPQLMYIPASVKVRGHFMWCLQPCLPKFHAQEPHPPESCLSLVCPQDETLIESAKFRSKVCTPPSLCHLLLHCLPLSCSLCTRKALLYTYWLDGLFLPPSIFLSVCYISVHSLDLSVRSVCLSAPSVCLSTICLLRPSVCPLRLSVRSLYLSVCPPPLPVCLLLRLCHSRTGFPAWCGWTLNTRTLWWDVPSLSLAHQEKWETTYNMQHALHTYIYTYIHTYIHTYTHTYIHMYTTNLRLRPSLCPNGYVHLTIKCRTHLLISAGSPFCLAASSLRFQTWKWNT